MTADDLKNIEIAALIDGGKNKVSLHRGVLNKVVDYIRQNLSKTIIHTDCILLANRTYRYEISDPELTHLIIDGAGAAMGGILINHITPHPDMIDGQELMLTFRNGGGLTFLPKNGVSTNIIFISSFGLVSPIWGADNFIAQKTTNSLGDLSANGIPIGYESNLKVLLKWSSSLNRWFELHRSGGNIY